MFWWSVVSVTSLSRPKDTDCIRRFSNNAELRGRTHPSAVKVSSCCPAELRSRAQWRGSCTRTAESPSRLILQKRQSKKLPSPWHPHWLPPPPAWSPCRPRRSPCQLACRTAPPWPRPSRNRRQQVRNSRKWLPVKLTRWDDDPPPVPPQTWRSAHWTTRTSTATWWTSKVWVTARPARSSTLTKVSVSPVFTLLLPVWLSMLLLVWSELFS